MNRATRMALLQGIEDRFLLECQKEAKAQGGKEYPTGFKSSDLAIEGAVMQRIVTNLYRTDIRRNG